MTGVQTCALPILQGSVITAAGIELTGAPTKATRLTAVEQAITGKGADAIATAAEQAANGWDANDDLHASAEYRRHLATVLTKRALTRAVAVATGQGQPRFGLW